MVKNNMACISPMCWVDDLHLDVFGAQLIICNVGAPIEKKISVAITLAEDGQPEIPDLPDNPALSLLRTLV